MFSKAIKTFFLLLIVALSGMALAYGEIVRCTFVGFSDFRKIEPRLYVSPSISKEQEVNIRSMISEARARIGYHFGEPVARPTIIVIDSDEQSTKFGIGNAPGTVFIAPWGNYLLLHLHKGDLDVAAHELVHAEIAARLGYFDRVRKIPTWLDEGIALQVDYRPEYSLLFDIEDDELARVTSLRSPNDFWTNNTALTIQNYRSAKLAVNETFFKKGTQSSLYSLLDRINKGADLSSLLGVEND